MTENIAPSEKDLIQYQEASGFFYNLLDQRNFMGYPLSYRYFRNPSHTILVSSWEYWASGKLHTDTIRSNELLLIAYLNSQTQQSDVENASKKYIFLPDFTQEILTFDGLEPYICIRTSGQITAQLVNGTAAQIKPYNPDIESSGHRTPPTNYSFVTANTQEATRILTDIEKQIKE